MTDPLAAMRANLRAFYRLLGERSAGGDVFEYKGLVASIVPACPERSIVNAVVYEVPDELAATRAELETRYRQAGVRAWTVWVPEGDEDARAVLRAGGHRLDASPRAMTRDLSEPAPAGDADREWEITTDTNIVAALNEAAYGLPAGEFAQAMVAMEHAPLRLYLARVDGRAATCLGTLDHDGDCGIYFVATAPEAQGRGLATRLLRSALADARARGCTTSSLQATQAGFPVYARCGFRDRCALEMWERRGA
jgi:GNAT superfamily N-acetyltransferase